MEFLFVLLFQATAGNPAQTPATEPVQQTDQTQTSGEQAEETTEPRRRMRCTRRAPTGARLERRVCDSQENIDRRQEQSQDSAQEMQRLRSGTPLAPP